ncbi:MAG: transposase [Patescibacteria group bacterium]|nr:transposase [Patescibacteria group bacterium]
MGRYCITIGCPKCGGCTKKYGRRHGRQRYCCLTCGYVFRRHKTRLPISCRDFNAFRDYAFKAVNQETLTKKLKLSRQELSARFNWLLTLPPAPELINRIVLPQAVGLANPWVYGYDGKWLGRNLVLLVHRDVTHKETLYWSVANSENIASVFSDLIALAGLGITRPKGAVTDGKPGIASVIKSIFHLDFCQRCLVHVERDLKQYLPQNSPIEATQRLRIACLGMTEIKSLSDRDCYLSMLDPCHRQSQSFNPPLHHHYPRYFISHLRLWPKHKRQNH